MGGGGVISLKKIKNGKQAQFLLVKNEIEGSKNDILVDKILTSKKLFWDYIFKQKNSSSHWLKKLFFEPTKFYIYTFKKPFQAF